MPELPYGAPFLRPERFRRQESRNRRRRKISEYNDGHRAARRGSLTVEAALAVPFFFLCMIALICVLDNYSILAREQVSLQVRAERLAEARSALEGGGSAPAVIDLPGVKTMKIFGLPFAPRALRFTYRARVRAWTGYDPDEHPGHAGGDEGKMVYVTDYESVYHTHSDCTHLDLTVECVSPGAARRRRNEYGKKYHACEKCIGSGAAGSVVYLSPHGDAYHNSSTCSGLTRHVQLKSLDETDGLALCSRCAAR